MEYEDQVQHVPNPKYDCLLFDVDDTLYPLKSGLSAECTKNIIEYMINKLGMEEDKAPEMCVQLYKDYGTTMAGLKAIGYDFDYDDYHRVVCFETLNPLNKTDIPDAKAALELNGSKSSTIRSTVTDFIDDSCETNAEFPKTPIVCKPFEDAFELALKIAKINPQRTLFFDDSIRNLQTAKLMGLHTVWVGHSNLTKGVDYALESIHNIKEALPELCEAIEKIEDIHFLEKVAIETSA